MTCSAGNTTAYHYTLALVRSKKTVLHHGVAVAEQRITTNQQYEAFKNKLRMMHGDVLDGAVLIKLAPLGE